MKILSHFLLFFEQISLFHPQNDFFLGQFDLAFCNKQLCWRLTWDNHFFEHSNWSRKTEYEAMFVLNSRLLFDFLYNFIKQSGKTKLKWLRIGFYTTDREMHVGTSVETLSALIANLMEFLLKNDVPNFSNSEATTKFILTFNSLWGIMNSQSIQRWHLEHSQECHKSRKFHRSFQILGGSEQICSFIGIDEQESEEESENNNVWSENWVPWSNHRY